MQRQIIYNLVEGDTYPPTPVRFVGLDLRNYDQITMHARRPDGTRFTKTLTKHVSDYELAFVTWLTAELYRGRYVVEFKLRRTGTTTFVTFPRKYPVYLDIRADNA